jgi:CheY-like chemotaxis protein
MESRDNISDSSRPNILVVEDAEGIADLYVELLEDDYCVRVCNGGRQVRSVIDQGCKFDLAIMDIVLPPEDPDRQKLEDCQETGIRLIKNMIENEVCRRFYVITVLKGERQRVEQLCKSNNVVCKFEYKLDYKPEKLLENVAELLRANVPH